MDKDYSRFLCKTCYSGIIVNVEAVFVTEQNMEVAYGLCGISSGINRFLLELSRRHGRHFSRQDVFCLGCFRTPNHDGICKKSSQISWPAS